MLTVLQLVKKCPSILINIRQKKLYLIMMNTFIKRLKIKKRRFKVKGGI